MFEGVYQLCRVVSLYVVIRCPCSTVVEISISEDSVPVRSNTKHLHLVILSYNMLSVQMCVVGL
jgi:hypothetical protein